MQCTQPTKNLVGMQPEQWLLEVNSLMFASLGKCWSVEKGVSYLPLPTCVNDMAVFFKRGDRAVISMLLIAK